MIICNITIFYIMKPYNFILSEKQFHIWNDKDLELLLKIFSGTSKISWIIHWNILMEMDKDLEWFVTHYRGLLNCLKYLNEKNSFLLLVKLWDVLLNLINNSSELAEILSKIPNESNKIRLLTIMRVKGLRKILFNAQDLWNILEWLYGESQRKFLDLLGRDLVREIFYSTNEIIMILHYLTNENKDYLMNIIWIGWVKTKIKTSFNFLVLFKWLTDKKARELLKTYTKKEVLALFKNDDEFYHFLLRLPKNKEKIFLKFIHE